MAFYVFSFWRAVFCYVYTDSTLRFSLSTYSDYTFRTSCPLSWNIVLQWIQQFLIMKCNCDWLSNAQLTLLCLWNTLWTTQYLQLSIILCCLAFIVSRLSRALFLRYLMKLNYISKPKDSLSIKSYNVWVSKYVILSPEFGWFSW